MDFDEEPINKGYNCLWLTIKNFDVFKLIVTKNSWYEVTRLIIFNKTLYENKVNHTGHTIHGL